MQSRKHPYCWLFGRLVWVMMLACHAYWLVKGLQGGTAATSTVFLGATIALFLLKALDVQFLRIDWNRRRVLAALLVVLLLHVGVFDEAMGGGAGWSLAWFPIETVEFGRILAVAGMLVMAALAAVARTQRQHAVVPQRVWPAIVALLFHHHERSLTNAPLRAPPSI
ncbi:MAG: hypothetical protein ACYTHJ_16540 [Planctomycetota bacterium]